MYVYHFKLRRIISQPTLVTTCAVSVCVVYPR